MDLCEAHLVVRDLDVSEAFYRDALGFRRAFRGEDVAFLWTDADERHQIGLWRLQGADDGPRPHTSPDVSRVARQHLAFGLPVAELEGTVGRFRQRGIRVRSFEGDEDDLSVHAWVPAVSAYFSDPDGHVLELYARLPDPPDAGAGVVPWKLWRARHEG